MKGWLTCFLAFLVLLAGLVLDGAEEREDDAGLGVDPDGGDDALAGPLHDVGAGEEHGVHVDPLLDLVGLAS